MMRRTELLIIYLGLVGPSLSAAEPRFTEMAGKLGLDFVHFTGMTGRLYILEEMGSGVALVDYDGDGDLDAYFVQGTLIEGEESLGRCVFQPQHALPLTDRLYRNDLELLSDGSVRARFVDVTEKIGLAAHGYGMGVAAGDLDNDGWTDLYVTNFGSNHLLHNNGDGTFSDVISESGADDRRWGVSAAIFDYDRDGSLDIYIGNYVDWRLELPNDCFLSGGSRDYCGPLVYRPQIDSLFHNKGDGTFESVSRTAGIEAEFGAALGVVSADFDADGWIDIYVANDASPNQLWMNQKDGTFVNDALLAGCAVNDLGMPEGSMGVVAGDFDGDGSVDLFMAHIVEETNTLYLNDGSGLFRDATRSRGLGISSFKFTGFGTALVDFDSDGWLDLFVANGSVRIHQELVDAGDPHPLREPNMLFRNVEGKRCEDVTPLSGVVNESAKAGRGVAAGDLDNDGDTDLLISNNAEAAEALISRGGEQRRWMGLRLIDSATGRDLSGVRVDATLDGGRTLHRWSGTDGSYASASDPRLLLGLGGAKRLGELQVTWPDGSRQRWIDPPLGRYLTLRSPGGP